MAAFDPATLDRWRALAIVDRDGTTVGTISEFYLDRETGYPTWALVNTGLFGATQTFVPLVHAIEIGDGLQVPYEKSHIKDTPRVDLHDELSPDEEATLFAHYGVEYQPSPGPAPGSAEAEGGSESGSLEPEAVPDEPGPNSAEPGSVEPGAVPAEARSGSTELGAVPAEPGSVEPGAVPAEAGSVEGTGAVSPEPGLAEAEDVPAEPGSVEGPGPVPADPDALDQRDQPAGSPATEPAPAEPGTMAASEPHYHPGPGEPTAQVPDEPGTSEPGDATLVAPAGLGTASELGEDPADAPMDARTDPDADPSQATPDPDLSRTTPVEPGLPGSTAAAPGPVPTTVDKGDAGWPPGFDDHGSADQPAGASDRWREAKLAAERNRIARAAAAPPEERSPLERARRRLERLVGVGQEPDLDDISPAERDDAERARRARLGLEDDDPRRR